MSFTATYHSTITATDSSLCLYFEEDHLWVLSDTSTGFIPEFSHFSESILSNTDLHHLGQLDGTPVFLLLGNAMSTLGKPDLSETFNKIALRDLFNEVSTENKILINLGYHILQWENNSQYCARCGSPMNFMQNQRGKTCPQCAHSVYPLVMPCIIVGIIKDNSHILLAEIKHKDSRFQSVLAGFIEAGETLEEAVIREVQEEVGIKIKNLEYFGSQPWGFSQSLMIAFMAEYKAGDIQVDGKEIQYADWYTADRLPNLPPEYSIARQMIESFRHTNQGKH